MKKNKILAFLLSLSIVTCLLSNLNPQSSDVFASYVFTASAREIISESLITVAASVSFSAAVLAVGCAFCVIIGTVIGIRDALTKEMSNNNKIKNDFRLCEKIKLKR